MPNWALLNLLLNAWQATVLPLHLQFTTEEVLIKSHLPFHLISRYLDILSGIFDSSVFDASCVLVIFIPTTSHLSAPFRTSRLLQSSYTTFPISWSNITSTDIALQPALHSISSCPNRDILAQHGGLSIYTKRDLLRRICP